MNIKLNSSANPEELFYFNVYVFFPQQPVAFRTIKNTSIIPASTAIVVVYVKLPAA